MKREVRRITVLIFTAPMRIDNATADAGRLCARIKARRPVRALVLIELIIVIAIMLMMVGLTTFSLSAVSTRSKFEKGAYTFINVLKMAQNAAAESDRRYAVILDFDEQTYTLRQFASLDLETIPPEEAIITTGNFTDQCYLDYVLFDDFEDTMDEEAYEARFYAGHSGWQYGGKIVLLDANGNPYSVIVNRLSRVITLQPGDVEILAPQYQEDVPF